MSQQSDEFLKLAIILGRYVYWIDLLCTMRWVTKKSVDAKTYVSLEHLRTAECVIRDDLCRRCYVDTGTTTGFRTYIREPLRGILYIITLFTHQSTN
jgi:hypothetical protein